MSDRETAPKSGAPAVTPYGGNRSNGEQKRKKVTVTRLAQMRAEGEKIAVLTAYDATFAAFADAAGVDCVLVGDSLGMVCQGRSSTVSVSLEEMRYHTQCVAQGLERNASSALLIADLPYGSFHQSREQAFASAVVLMQAGAQMIKLEGGGWTVEIVAFLTERGIPVCAHLGLTPQTVAALGGYKVQGREQAAAAQLLADARAVAAAGASLLVLECVPTGLAKEITAAVDIPTIGIGAGPHCDGQVLVLHDLLGLDSGHRRPRFVKDFLAQGGSVAAAVQAYAAAVREGSFPDAEHAYA